MTMTYGHPGSVENMSVIHCALLPLCSPEPTSPTLTGRVEIAASWSMPAPKTLANDFHGDQLCVAPQL